MSLRHVCLFWCLACVGCHAASRQGVGSEAAAEQLRRHGLAALQNGQPEQAIVRYEESLAADGRRTRNHLSLATAQLEAGKPSEACRHLGEYLKHHPDQAIVRAQFAELLLRLGRRAEARLEFERFLQDAAERSDVEIRRRVHAHGRLMELAEQDEDGYLARLHRGIGLLLLACGRAELDEPGGELPVEGLLCKAAAELNAARELEPDDARPCWYLHLAWQRLGQQQLAERWLQQTADADSSSLTAAEQRSLHLALAHENARKMTR